MAIRSIDVRTGRAIISENDAPVFSTPEKRQEEAEAQYGVEADRILELAEVLGISGLDKATILDRIRSARSNQPNPITGSQRS